MRVLVVLSGSFTSKLRQDEGYTVSYVESQVCTPNIPFPWFTVLAPVGGLLELDQSELWSALALWRQRSFDKPDVHAPFVCCVFADVMPTVSICTDCTDAESMSTALSCVESGLANRFVRTCFLLPPSANDRFGIGPSVQIVCAAFGGSDAEREAALMELLQSHDVFRRPNGEFSSDIKW